LGATGSASAASSASRPAHTGSASACRRLCDACAPAPEPEAAPLPSSPIIRLCQRTGSVQEDRCASHPLSSLVPCDAGRRQNADARGRSGTARQNWGGCTYADRPRVEQAGDEPAVRELLGLRLQVAPGGAAQLEYSGVRASQRPPAVCSYATAIPGSEVVSVGFLLATC
jgi:hypothetical protein